MSFLLPLLFVLILSWWLNANFATIKGAIGEKHIVKELQKLDSTHYFLMNDLYIPKKDGTTSQIDHLVISDKGIFVIETKNYQGWITGTENNQYWTQIIYKRKEKFFNPIWQNAGHIKAIQEYLGDAVRDCPIHSIIVFGKQAEFKFKTPFTRAEVIKSKHLLTTIRNHTEPIHLSKPKIEEIKKMLMTTAVQDKREKKAIKKQHISTTKKNLAVNHRKVTQDICPRCGGKLVDRTGKHGKFKGCNNFPKCRFTV